jgi:fructosamine-3-kinase
MATDLIRKAVEVLGFSFQSQRGSVIRTADGQPSLFCKILSGNNALEMAQAELESLNAIERAAPGLAVRGVAACSLSESPAKALFLAEHVKLESLSDANQAELGGKLAELVSPVSQLLSH